MQGLDSKKVIRLRQYEPLDTRLSGSEARSLLEASRGALNVVPSSRPGVWTVTAGNRIGTLVAGGHHVLIRPKIPLANVFTLLEVGVPKSSWSDDQFGYGEAPDLLSAVISWFARLVETALGRGLLRNYREQEERLTSIRGRVDVDGLFRQPGIALPVPCRFDEFTSDIPENQCLRAAIRRAAFVPGVPLEDQRRLRRELARLEDVSDVAVNSGDFDRITFDRLNQHYEPALRLARLLLENLSMTDRVGAVSAASFLVNMDNVFERFVAGRLRTLLRGRMMVSTQTRAYLGTDRHVAMKPDLEFVVGGKSIYVGDTKYKLTDTAEGKSSDYYQLLAYTTALDIDEGVLIYCRNAGGSREKAVTVRHAGKRLMTYALDLSGSTADIHDELKALADWITERSMVSSAMA